MGLKRVATPSKTGVVDKNKLKILYVEDDDINWTVAEISLRDRYLMLRAKTAEQAFEILSKKKFDLILMDIQLQGSALNGIEITKILRGHTAPAMVPDFAKNIGCSGARIIFCTAYSARYKKEELLEAGGDELITKPVDFIRLSLLMSQLSKKALNQEST